MSEELKPCPFCGSSELLGFETSHEGGWTIVKCRKCGCSGSTGLSTSEQEAAAFWNRRATHHAPTEQVEVVENRKLDKLKNIAKATCSFCEEDWFIPENLRSCMEKEDSEFVSAVSPFTLLALIDAFERVTAERDKINADRKACWGEFKALVKSSSEKERYLQGEIDQLRADQPTKEVRV